MSCRVDTTPLIAGACVVSLYAGHGVRGDAVPSTGDDGPSPVYQGLSLPGDAAKEYRWAITARPSVGVLVEYEDCSFSYTPPPATETLSESFAFRTWEDGVDLGERTASIFVGSAPAVVAAGTSATAGSAPAATQRQLGDVADGGSAGEGSTPTATQRQAGAVQAGAAGGLASAPAGAQRQVGSVAPGVSATFGPAVGAIPSPEVLPGTSTTQGSTVAAAQRQKAVVSPGTSTTQGSTVSTAAPGTADPAGVWGYVLSNGKTAGQNQVEIHAMLTALLAGSYVLPVDVLKMNGAPVIGDGTVGNDWRGVGVQPQ